MTTSPVFDKNDVLGHFVNLPFRQPMSMRGKELKNGEFVEAR